MKYQNCMVVLSQLPKKEGIFIGGRNRWVVRVIGYKNKIISLSSHKKRKEAEKVFLNYLFSKIIL